MPRHLKRTLLLLALPASLLLAGCGLLFAEVEIPLASITLVREPVVATPPGTDLSKDIDFDLGGSISLLTDKDVSYEVRLDLLEIALSQVQPTARPDLGTIDTVTITVVAPAGSGLATREVVRYVKVGAGPVTSISATANGDVDLGPYLRSGKLTLRISGTGTLPNYAWNADITGTFYMKLKLNYGNKLGG
jgi:hypothetical protein